MTTPNQLPGSVVAAPANQVAALLRGRSKKSLALVLLLPVLVVAWIPVLRGRGRPAAAPPPVGSTGSIGAAGSSAARDIGSANAVATVEGAVTAADLGLRMTQLRDGFRPRWRPDRDDDPFRVAVVRGAVQTAPAGSQPAVVDRRALVPTSVFLSSSRTPVAIIDGRAYRPGDVVQGHTIVAIEERRVLLRGQGEVFAVEIPRPEVGGRHD